MRPYLRCFIVSIVHQRGVLGIKRESGGERRIFRNIERAASEIWKAGIDRMERLQGGRISDAWTG